MGSKWQIHKFNENTKDIKKWLLKCCNTPNWLFFLLIMFVLEHVTCAVKENTVKMTILHTNYVCVTSSVLNENKANKKFLLDKNPRQMSTWNIIYWQSIVTQFHEQHYMWQIWYENMKFWNKSIDCYESTKRLKKDIKLSI